MDDTLHATLAVFQRELEMLQHIQLCEIKGPSEGSWLQLNC